MKGIEQNWENEESDKTKENLIFQLKFISDKTPQVQFITKAFEDA